jgi:hypothetical protein
MDLSAIASCRIHPAIGIARVGGSEGFIIGPEVPGQLRPAPGPDGFKDESGQLLRQAARFRIYAYDASGQVLGEVTPGEGVDVTWTVDVANTKAAWYDFDLAMDIPEFDGSLGTPPMSSALRNATQPDRAQLAITPKPRSISGRNTTGAEYIFDDGKFFAKTVPLGELQTDADGRLIFLPAFGKSASEDGEPAHTFANNPLWHDDVADGPVTATVSINGTAFEAEHAWVVVAPPDYAPGVIAFMTMYDVIRDAGWQLEPSLMPARPSYQRDIMPLFKRLADNQWVNSGFGKLFGWRGSDDLDTLLASLGDNSAYARPRRQSFFVRFRNPDYLTMEPDAIPPVYGDGMDVPPNDPREWLAVTNMQYEMLRRWAEGDFIPDYNPAVPPQNVSEIPLQEQPEALDVAALENTIGGPFHPGCEMTWPMRQPIMYEKPFRLKLRKGAPPSYGPTLDSAVALGPNGPLDGSGPGDVSRWMAVPWQTDTSSCLYAYVGYKVGVFLPTFWPVRVPNTVLTQQQYDVVKDTTATMAARRAAFAYDTRPFWLRALGPRSDYETMINGFVAKWNEVGVVTAQPGADPFPATIHVELGMNVEQPTPGLLAKAAAAIGVGEVAEEEGDLPNPRLFR